MVQVDLSHEKPRVWFTQCSKEPRIDYFGERIVILVPSDACGILVSWVAMFPSVKHIGMIGIGYKPILRSSWAGADGFLGFVGDFIVTYRPAPRSGCPKTPRKWTFQLKPFLTHLLQSFKVGKFSEMSSKFLVCHGYYAFWWISGNRANFKRL